MADSGLTSLPLSGKIGLTMLLCFPCKDPSTAERVIKGSVLKKISVKVSYDFLCDFNTVHLNGHIGYPDSTRDRRFW
jgi:hypothetical protein